MNYTPDPVTPKWSRDLAEIRQNGTWRDYEQRDAFIAVASRYATYADLPPKWQSVYRQARRPMQTERPS